MSENYYSPEQKQYRDPIAAGNLLTRMGIVGSSEEDLKQILNMDPTLLNESEAAIAGYAQQQEHQAIAEAALANSLTTETLSADAPATEVPDSPESISSGEETMLTESDEETTPWLAEEPPLWGGDE